MGFEITAELALTREELAHIYQGGLISVKISGPDGNASLEISCVDSPPSKGTHIRFKHVHAN